MTFAHPATLWLLALLPLIVAIHLLREERRTRVVSSLYLWSDLGASSRRAWSLRSLRSLSLLLLLLATGFVVLAAADPRVPVAGGATADRIVVIIDTSPSMHARSAGIARVDLARNRARERIGRARGTPVMIVAAGSTPRIVETATTDSARLFEALASVEATGGALDARKLTEFVAATVADGSTEFVVITDPAGEATLAAESWPVALTVDVVGEPEANRAITAFELRALPSAPGFEAYIGVGNFADEPGRLVVEIRSDGALVERLPVTLAGREERFETTRLPAGAAVYSAELADNRDALAADDGAWAAVGGERALRVQLVTPGNPFLEAFFAIYPRTTVELRSRFDAAVASDLVVFDRVAVPAGVRGSVIAIGTAVTNGPFTPVSQAETPAAVSARNDHPVMRDVAVERVVVTEALTGTFDPRVAVVAWSRDVPLIYAFRSDSLSLVGLTFSLWESDLGVRSGFPVLMSNALRWLAPLPGASDAGYHAPGARVRIPVPPGEEVVVIGPDGSPSRLRPTRGVVEFDRTGQPGVYQIRGESFTDRFAVSIASSGESDLLAHAVSTRESDADRARFSGGTPTRSLWSVAALLALLFLCAEWIVWLRGSR